MERHNNQDRLATLYDEHSEAIYRYCFFRVYSKQRAEELMQETFLKYWKYIQEDKQIDNERALLYTIATHLVIDDKRKARTDSLDAMLEVEGSVEPAAIGAERDPINSAMMREVQDELAKLSPEEQELFKLRYVDDLDPKEIASIRGTGANVISVQLNRIMHKLRDALS
jgi:RNA polymerase sigma-70 factor (ECF subfamily)